MTGEHVIDDVPLSFAQSRLWMLDRIRPGDPTYNIGLAFDLDGAVDSDRLQRALDALVDAHEILRTTYPDKDGMPVQRIWAGVSLPLEREQVGERVLPERVDAITGAPFDLENGPVARAALLEVNGGRAVFVLVIHHIAADRWSLRVLLGDLASAYATAGAAVPLPRDRAQYADFALWQAAEIEPRLDALVEQARRELADQDVFLELPADFPRLAVASHAAGRVRKVLDPDAWEQLVAFARDAETTPFAVLLSIYGCLLARLSGQESFSIGTVMANRDHAELEDVVGICLNTLPVPFDAGERSLVEQVRTLRASLAKALDRAHVPFELLVDRLDPSRDLGRTPMVQAVFNMLNVDERPLELEGVVVTPREEPLHGTSFDLTIYARACAAGLELEAVYAADLFRHDRAVALLEQFERLLRGALAAPNLLLTKLPLQPSGGRSDLPDPRAPLSSAFEGDVPSVVARWARVAPDRPAVAGASATLTYGQLAAQASAVALALRRAGAERGDTVAVLPTRDVWCAVAVLGTLWAGAAVAVLDPGDPPTRLAEHAEAAGARILACCDMAHLAAPPGCVAEAVIDVADVAIVSQDAPITAPVAADPDDLAVVGFTSGTTAARKVVRGRHGSLTHFMPWMERAFALTEADRFCVLSGLSHDPLQRDLFTPWFVGGSVHFPTHGELLEPRALAEHVRDRRITILHITPPLARHLARAGIPMPTVRQVFFIGDAVRAADVRAVATVMPAARVVALYGATESQRASGWAAVDVADPPAVAPLGVGMPDSQLLVLAGDGLADVGEAGEIAIRSPHLALGYADPRQTAERFAANPWTGVPGDRLYRTGDLGRFRLDGSVEWTGRQDRMVKIRAHRVDPREVEAALMAQPEVGEAAVLPAGAGDDRHLVAFLAVTDAIDGSGSLVERLRAVLPEYMVPRRHVLRERLPLTPNFKVDYRELARDAAELGPVPAPGAMPPRTPLEEVLAAVWSEVLDAPVDDRAANFYALGGHSLAASRIAALCRRRLGLDVTVVQVLRHPTVELLAAAMLADAIGTEVVAAS